MTPAATAFSTPANGSCTQRRLGLVLEHRGQAVEVVGGEPDQGVGLFTELDRQPAAGSHRVLGEPTRRWVRWRCEEGPLADPRDPGAAAAPVSGVGGGGGGPGAAGPERGQSRRARQLWAR